ncbi:Purine-binding protein [Neomoorella glycerini]|uniref:Purine-binding protein n=1 Tax=Neomoorella glycerini TaxID=55779 RepID=A0A6I5ZMF0_9FIRM|nr:BMP family protein [Moorella glycerini]QGP90801.1 Purine-binding protein [Moorella glycerini]
MKVKSRSLLLAGLLVLLLATALVFSGCGGNSKQAGSGGQSSPAGAGGKPGDFKVALVLNGPINDNGWNAAGYNGVKAVEKELGIQTAYSENVSKSDQEEVLRGYATQGYNLIFAHGFEFVDTAKKVAPQFPKTIFIVTNGYFSDKNISSFSVNSAEMGFLEGAAAAILTKSKKVAAIGGEETTPIKLGIEGFKQGAKYIDPNVEVLSTFIGSFSDVGKMKEVALSMINQGADVVLGNANQAGLGAIQAAKEKKVYAIGSSFDQHSVAPDTVVTSGVQNIGKAMIYLAKTVMEGKYQPAVYMVGVKEGAVYLAPLYDFEQKLPADIVKKIKQVPEDIKNGKVKVDLDTKTGKVTIEKR